MPKRINPRRRPATMADVQRAKDTATADACRVTLAIFFTALWTAYTGTDVTPKDVAMMMALLKIARAKAGSKPDTYVDLAGYAACGAEISAREPKRGSERTASTTGAAGGTEAEKTASCVKLQRMDGYYLVDVDGNSHRFTLWETAMQFIREHAGELT